MTLRQRKPISMYCSVPAADGITKERFRTADAVYNSTGSLGGYVGTFASSIGFDPFSQPQFLVLVLPAAPNAGALPKQIATNLIMEVKMKYYVECFRRKTAGLQNPYDASDFPAQIAGPAGMGPEVVVPVGPPALPIINPLPYPPNE